MIPILLIFNLCGVRFLKFGNIFALIDVLIVSNSKSISPDSPVATKILFLKNAKSLILGILKSDGISTIFCSMVELILIVIFNILSLLIPIIKLSSLFDLK